MLEGVVFSLRDCLEAMIGLGVHPTQVRAIGGGARSELWRQMQADIFGLPIYRTVIEEGPAYGAALLATVSAGVFASVEEACALVRLRPEVVEPDPERIAIYQTYYDAYAELYSANAGVMHRLAELTSQPDNSPIMLGSRL